MNTRKNAGSFTAAPWYTETNVQGKIIIWAFDTPGSPRIAVASVYAQGKMEANGRLIVACPELLAALEGLLDMITDNRLHGPEVDTAATALYKARGAS